MNELPWRRHGADQHFDQSRPIAAGKSASERRAQPGRVLGALGGGAEALRKPQEIRIGEIAGDQAVAELSGLKATHIAEATVIEHDGDQRNAVVEGRGQFVCREHEAAVARNGKRRHIGPSVLSAERGRVAPAEIVLIAGRKESARRVDREGEAGDEADLGHLVDEDAVLRQFGPDGIEEGELGASLSKRAFQRPWRLRISSARDGRLAL